MQNVNVLYIIHEFYFPVKHNNIPINSHFTVHNLCTKSCTSVKTDVQKLH
jgi:hypothetical protein